MSENYWIDFWNKNSIIDNSDLQLQIGRSINKIPISAKNWNLTLQFIRKKLDLNKEDTLIDICSGNGLISHNFSLYVNEIISIDISEKLILEINKKNIPNIKTKLCDVREINFNNNMFSKAIFYFALQHFTNYEIVNIFKKIFNWLMPNGKLYIGDIPDIEKIWVYYNNDEREFDFFQSLENMTPIIGSWFNKDFLLKLSKYCGFKNCEIIEQEQYMINSHYRFDLLLTK
ncbi:MAG: class I SAM-dependent methyltransferase [Bacteroidales bacterium]|nr:class I SAM-dependent methyltransferase [Bacteroidales bacterium]